MLLVGDRSGHPGDRRVGLAVRDEEENVNGADLDHLPAGTWDAVEVVIPTELCAERIETPGLAREVAELTNVGRTVGEEHGEVWGRKNCPRP